MKQKFTLGPRQTAWINSLKENAHRQISGQLAKKQDDGTYGACCLGEAAIILGVGEWNTNNNLVVKYPISETRTGTCVEYLSGDAYKEMGLFAKDGSADLDLMRIHMNNDEFEHGEPLDSLAEMNDEGIKWPAIAEHLEKYAIYYFTEPK